MPPHMQQDLQINRQPSLVAKDVVLLIAMGLGFRIGVNLIMIFRGHISKYMEAIIVPLSLSLLPSLFHPIFSTLSVF
jgi:hypothetical protein